MAKMVKRLYVVTEQLSDGSFKNHLVNSVSKSRALMHVVGPKHVVWIASALDVAKVMQFGEEIQEASNADLDEEPVQQTIEGVGRSPKK